MCFYQLRKWLYQRVEHVWDAPPIPLPNSAAIPLSVDLAYCTQSIELHLFFDERGRFFDAEKRLSLLSGTCDAGLTDDDEVGDAGFHDVADAALARGGAVRGGRRGSRLRRADDRRARPRRLHAARLCGTGDRADRIDAVDRGRLPAQPDGRGEPGLGPTGELERAVCARARQPGQRPQRAPLWHFLERAGTTAARLCPGIAGGLALLGEGREARLPGRALPADPDDPRLLARADRATDGAGHDRRRRRGDAPGRRRGVRRGAPASLVLAPLSRRGRIAAHDGRDAPQRA